MAVYAVNPSCNPMKYMDLRQLLTFKQLRCANRLFPFGRRDHESTKVRKAENDGEQVVATNAAKRYVLPVFRVFVLSCFRDSLAKDAGDAVLQEVPLKLLKMKGLTA